MSDESLTRLLVIPLPDHDIDEINNNYESKNKNKHTLFKQNTPTEAYTVSILGFKTTF